MGDKKSIGIVTDPSKTFKMTSKNRVFQVQYDQLPKEFQNKKQPFLDFLGGNFQEVNTLAHELSSKGNVSVVLYLDRNLFISENFRISPYELTHPKTVKESLDFDKWIDGKDVLIISLCTEKLKKFIHFYHTKILRIETKWCVISTGKVMINELARRFPESFIFTRRKGVARFGVENRQKILGLLS